MRILITGGLGFIGSAVVRAAIADGHTVLNIDKQTYAADPRTVASAETSPAYSHERVDICDSDSVHDAVMGFRPDRIIHLAAESHVDRSIDGPDVFVRTNVVGTASMLSAARAYHHRSGDDDFRFVHVSTDEVFGSLEANDPPFDERTPYDPRSPYSASKAASDHLARAWHHTYGLPVLVTNCSNNYGPFQFPEKLIPLMIIKALHREPLPVYGTGENVRDWLHVSDHARGLLRAAEVGDSGSTYLFGGDGERSNLEVVDSICDLVDELNGDQVGERRSLVSFVTDRPGHDHRYAIDYGSAQRGLGWSPTLDFETGLADTVRWYLDNREFWEPILDRRYAGERLGSGG